MRALAEGPFGKCVYHCDNDQVDHQETMIQFENGVTAVLKMHGFAAEECRTLRIDGSRGTLRGKYGGGLTPDDDDNSGILKYVSIRHGGIGIAADNEINGLTMGGVGRGTVISHVEVFANFDDGFEWFGGTVNSKYLITWNIGDDSFDTDRGYRGKSQFGLVVKGVCKDGESGSGGGVAG